MALKIRDDRQNRALLGLSDEKFKELVIAFETTYEKAQTEAYQAGFAAGTRQRAPGGGQKGKLPTAEDKLTFILYYWKRYPTMDDLAERFDMVRSSACDWVHKLTPYLSLTLIELEVLPARSFENPEELRKACEGIERIIIDATEREIQRPTDYEEQKDYYSGKQKDHTVKNTVISSPDKVVLFVGATFSGRNHDYKVLKTEFPPDQPWFKDINLTLDLGYQGILKDYEGDGIDIPFKKPAKSDDNPDPQLTAVQQLYNYAVGKARIYVEQAIGGVKKFNILVHDFRNRKVNFIDDAIGISAGLWNFSIA